MRIRAGIVLIEDNRVALIERHRAGLHYFVFPGGGVDEVSRLSKLPSVRRWKNWGSRSLSNKRSPKSN